MLVPFPARRAAQLTHRERAGARAIFSAVALASLTTAALLALWTLPAAARSETPVGTPIACGEPATSWSSATASGIEGGLARIEQESPVAGDPAETRRLSARLTLVNGSAATLPIERADFALVTCDGAVHPAVVDPDRRFFPDELRAGDGAAGWVTFRLPERAEPALIVFRAGAGTNCRAWLGFPLRLPGDSDATAGADLDAATPAATPPILAPCPGGSATAGVGTGGVAGGDAVSGADGAAGGDAVGGDATGGAGCPGEDATGGSATGGDGGDGGDATAGGTGAADDAPVCHDSVGG